MTKKSLGYTELEWQCPRCGNRNRGSDASCVSCGTPQPDDVEFLQPAQEELIENEEKIAAAKAGPDIHCGYCGTRNPATAKICRQCGGDLSEGQERVSGAVLGAHRDEPAPPIVCTACGTENPANFVICTNCGAALPKAESKPEPPKKETVVRAPKTRWLLIAVIAIVLLCAGLFYFTSRTSETVGEVSDVKWSRSIAIMGLVPVERETWESSLPDGASVGMCSPRLHHTEEEPVPGAREVCGTPYTVDTGTGLGEVVQDCKYEVYREWCEYTVDEWQVVNTLLAEGHDFNPTWPALTLATGQREGEREESYVIIFSSDEDTYRLSSTRPDIFQKYPLSSRWRLEVNTFGSVMDTEPLQ